LASSSKLQPCLQLCQFIQALYKRKVARWKAHSSSEFAKRPLCNIYQNGWHITQGTQPERRLLRLESRGYNKSHPCPKLSASMRLLSESIPCLLQTLLDFPKHCMHIIHFQLSVLLSLHRSSRHIVVVSQVPSCHPFYALLVFVYCRSRMSTPHGVGLPLSHVILISHVTSRTILSESSK
jgi:hypothetical protein